MKDATEATRAANRAALAEMPLGDKRSFDDAQRGFVEALGDQLIVRADGRLVWTLAGYEFLGTEDAPDTEKMLAQEYRGSRYSFGYPACPRLEDQEAILRLLGAERLGISLSDEFQLHPEQSTSAIVVLNPRAKYFSV